MTPLIHARLKLANKSSEPDIKNKVVDEGIDSGTLGSSSASCERKRMKLVSACSKPFDPILIKSSVVEFSLEQPWGKFNNKTLNQNKIKRLTATFKNNLENCTIQMTMDVAIDPDRLLNKDPILRTVEGLKLKNVPEINFNIEGSWAIRSNNFWVLGGNHRRIALTTFRDKMKEDLSELNADMKAMKEIDSNQDLEDEQREQLDFIEGEVTNLEDRIYNSTMLGDQDFRSRYVSRWSMSLACRMK